MRRIDLSACRLAVVCALLLASCEPEPVAMTEARAAMLVGGPSAEPCLYVAFEPADDPYRPAGGLCACEAGVTIEALGLVEEGEELFGNLATSLTPEFDADLPLTLQDGECLPLEVSGGPTWKQGSPCPRRDRAVLVMQVEGVDGPNVRTAAWDVFPGVGTPCSTTFDVDGEPGFAPWSPVPLDYWGGIFGNGPDDIDIRYRPTFRPDRLVVTVAGPPGTEPVVEQKWGWDRFNLTIETEGVYWVTFEPTFEHGGCPRCQTTALILDVQY